MQMQKKKEKTKGPVTQEVIFKIMMMTTYAVASVFFLENVFSKNVQSMLIIGGALLAFTIITLVMRRMNFSQYTKQFVLCICLVLLVFAISANVGTFYSDDFPLFLALIGLSGLYLEPRYTQVQGILITIILIVLYVMHPEKADPFSQYFMCVLLLDVAAITIYLTIKRGRAFIEISQLREAEAAQLVSSMKSVGEELKENYIQSTNRLAGMKAVNLRLEENTDGLTSGSEEIQRGTQELENSFSIAHTHIRNTGGKIEVLNQDIKKVEVALEENKAYLQNMGEQVALVSQAVHMTTEVFTQLEKQVREISSLTEQLSTIAFNTNILALNAAIEAARAGEYGSGFAVVADEVQSLAAKSDTCSNNVSDVVTGMQNQIALTASRMSESAQIILSSQQTMECMEKSFQNLMTQFDDLYKNIAEQNENVLDVDNVFETLEQKVAEMENCSQSNQATVESIVAAIRDYKQYTDMIVEDTKQIQKLSASMVDGSVV